jgi:preprotein translocase subunit YajC
LVAIAALFWLLIIRPASRRQKDQSRMQSALAEGDRVMLTSGIFGTVTEMTDEGLMVEVAPGVALRVARGAIGTVVPAEEPEAETQVSDADELSEEN